MRIVIIAAGVAALLCAACTKADDTAEAGTVEASSAHLDPSAVDGQTLDQVLDKTMNRFAKIDLNGDGKLTQAELNAATEGGDKTDPPPIWWTPMLGFWAWRGVSDERYASGVSGGVQA